MRCTNLLIWFVVVGNVLEILSSLTFRPFLYLSVNALEKLKFHFVVCVALLHETWRKEQTDDKKRVEEVLQILRKQAPLTVKQEKFCSDACVERFLKSKGDNVKNAEKHLRSCLSWRESIGTGFPQGCSNGVGEDRGGGPWKIRGLCYEKDC